MYSYPKPLTMFIILATAPTNTNDFPVVSNKGANSGSMAVPEALDQAVSPLSIDFTTIPIGQYAYSLGYPVNRDPDLRFCADTITARPTIGYLLTGCDTGREYNSTRRYENDRIVAHVVHFLFSFQLVALVARGSPP
jgi:hypothetical protein